MGEQPPQTSNVTSPQGVPLQMLEGKKTGVPQNTLWKCYAFSRAQLGVQLPCTKKRLLSQQAALLAKGLPCALSGSVSLVHESESQFNLFVTNVKEAGAKQTHGPTAYSEGLCLHSQSQMCLISKYETISVPFIFTTFWRVTQSLWEEGIFLHLICNNKKQNKIKRARRFGSDFAAGSISKPKSYNKLGFFLSCHSWPWGKGESPGEGSSFLIITPMCAQAWRPEVSHPLPPYSFKLSLAYRFGPYPASPED